MVERAMVAAAADGRLDLQSALVYGLVVVVVAVIANVWVRRHVPRGRRRGSNDGPDDLRRHGAAWNLAPWDAYRSWRSQLHDGSGTGPSRPDADGSDPGETPPPRDRGPFLG